MTVVVRWFPDYQLIQNLDNTTNLWFLRFAVIKFNIKNVLKVSYFVLTFISLRMLLNYRASQISEILEHHYFKEKIISVKQNNKVRFLMKENLNPEKIEKFVIEPYLTSRRTNKSETTILGKPVEKIEINGNELATNDVDEYEGRYGVEDMRQAVTEARLQGIAPFCLTIDRQAATYLPAVFGPHNYALLPRPDLLPAVLLDWLRRLVTA